ncbi:MAG TPA: hypothetical protein O0X45_06325 [Methanocorpusculum sp.]|nr:hypothetical protein [Methanocorpusculum sp.]
MSSISHLPVYSAPEPPVVKGLSPAHAILAVVLAVSGPESAAVCRDAALKSADLVGHCRTTSSSSGSLTVSLGSFIVA